VSKKTGDLRVNDDTQVELIARIADLAEEATLNLVRQRLADGDDPLHIIEHAQTGMRMVGKRYEQGQYYIAGLIMAEEIFSQVMELTQPLVEAQLKGHVSGTVLMGTVQGDIHDLGKNIAALLLRCYGFEVHDLGVNVPPDQFVAHALELQPHIVGLSSLLTAAYDSMKETIKLLRSATQKWERPPVIVIGGSQLNDQVFEYVGADHWCNDARDGVALCQQVVQDI
jgi:methylmalonyl-CoA mutase cobalamin-binding domain/chain